MRVRKAIEAGRANDVYALSPMQEGMLFHSLSEPHAGFEIGQLVCDLHEDLAPGHLRTAWKLVIRRHDVLRTAFRFLAQPLQQVQKEVPLPWSEQDWSGLSSEEQAEAFDSFLRADRARGFDLTQAPVHRLTLVRLGACSFRLVWTFHHALLDGRSLPLVLREVFETYEALRRDQPIEIPASRPYREFIEQIGRRDLGRAELFWRGRLQGFAAPTPLAARLGTPRWEKAARRGEEVCRLSGSATGELESLAEAHGLTMSTLLHGAWGLILSRYTGEEDVVFGVTRAGRSSQDSGEASTAGLFINTLPLRVRIDSQEALLPWLKNLRAQWTSMREYQHTPLPRVQGWSDVPAGMALFESIVVFERLQLDAILKQQGGAWLNRDVCLIEQPGSPLVLAAYGGRELCLKILFDRQQFGSMTIVRALGHLRTLLLGMARRPEQRLEEVPLLTEGERLEIMAEHRRSKQQFPESACLHEMFEAAAQRNPDRTAVRCGDRQVTYRELDLRASRLALDLRERGVKAETLVGICMESSPELVAGILGILKAGGCYVPLDPGQSSERVASILKEAGSPLLLTEEPLRRRFELNPSNLVILGAEDAGRTGPARKVLPPPDPGPTPASLAYVIHTSGSTGKPKGVMVTHHNVVRLFQSTQALFEFGPNDVWTLFHSPAFDFSVWEMWGALLHGGTLVVVPHLLGRSPDAFRELLAREKVTVLNQTPSAFKQLIEADRRSGQTRNLALRWIILGGEALDPAHLEPWFDRHGDQTPQVVNMYGITETTVHVTCRRLTKADLNAGSVIGRPLPDLELYILDRFGQPVPIGVAGEIYVGGAGLARGYLHRPDLTAERFVPHRFNGGLGARLYRTGDRARMREEGDIEYLGRVDDQIKIRGYRIEPGEIEAVLRMHPAVGEAVVVAREDKPDQKRLVAYVVPRQTRPEPAQFRAMLRTHLPGYMIPAATVWMEKLPLNGNGKVDRRALPPPEPVRGDSSPRWLAPRTALERRLASVWQELLGVEKVGLHDNFFDMGGHSLLLVQFQYRLQSELDRDVAITALFQYPTIHALARHLSEEPRVPTPPLSGSVLHADH